MLIVSKRIKTKWTSEISHVHIDMHMKQVQLFGKRCSLVLNRTKGGIN